MMNKKNESLYDYLISEFCIQHSLFYITLMLIEQFKAQLNQWGKHKVPFLFYVDFELQQPVALPLDQINSHYISFDINGVSNVQRLESLPDTSTSFYKTVIPFAEYEHKFNVVMNHLSYGDSFLTNLTVKTKIDTNLSLKDLFARSTAKYKLLVNDQFLVFSPETFIQIHNGNIYSYPMKGTIDASILNAAEIILNDQKEKAEHITIVDLIRNDLSLVATNVHVSRFRYIDELKTNAKNLLQVSSEITGTLPDDYRERLGDILVALLPAGSVSGAPKQKTLKIIADAEGENRGYYTGVMGYFDGEIFDSGVMIRFIEQKNNTLYYRSGGGITTQSNVNTEYQEVIDKVYVPLN
jgi:para-aminobenzoate synthetase component I